MTAIDRIWLDPECQSDADYHIDRCWHSTRPDDYEDCGAEPEEFISRATHDRLIAEAVAAEREQCVSAIQAKIDMLKVVTESMKSVGGYGDEIRLGEFKITAMQEAIAAIRGQS